MRTKIQRGCGMRARDSRCKRACLVARTALAVCFGATVAGVAAARAEPTFPSNPMHISGPYVAGGVAAPGSPQNLSAHPLKQVSGADVTIIPYKTTPDLVTAVLRGDVDLGFDFYAGLQAVISDNKVRIIATSGEERNPLLREVPTAKESGFPDYVVTSWNRLASAAGMPADQPA